MTFWHNSVIDFHPNVESTSTTSLTVAGALNFISRHAAENKKLCADAYVNCLGVISFGTFLYEALMIVFFFHFFHRFYALKYQHPFVIIYIFFSSLNFIHTLGAPSISMKMFYFWLTYDDFFVFDCKNEKSLFSTLISWIFLLPLSNFVSMFLFHSLPFF